MSIEKYTAATKRIRERLQNALGHAQVLERMPADRVIGPSCWSRENARAQSLAQLIKQAGDLTEVDAHNLLDLLDPEPDPFAEEDKP